VAEYASYTISREKENVSAWTQKKFENFQKKELTKSGGSGILSKLSDRAAARRAALKKSCGREKKGVDKPWEVW